MRSGRLSVRFDTAVGVRFADPGFAAGSHWPPCAFGEYSPFGRPSCRTMTCRAEDLVDIGWIHGDDVDNELANRPDPVNVGLVCHAATRALLVAAQDERFEPDKPPSEWMGEYGAVDPESMDASYLAAAVASGGWPNEEDPGVGKRRAFWRWYLREAIPQAWEAG